jgi:hypothetical protein
MNTGSVGAFPSTSFFYVAQKSVNLYKKIVFLKKLPFENQKF